MSKKVVSKGVLMVGYAVNCGKCQCYMNQLALIPLQHIKSVVSNLTKLGWKRSSYYGWMCDTCISEREKVKKAKEKSRKRNAVIFKAMFEL